MNNQDSQINNPKRINQKGEGHENKITEIHKHGSLIVLDISHLNSPMKRHRLTDWITKQDPSFCRIQEMHISIKYRNHLMVKGWKQVFQEMGTKKQVSIAILIFYKIDFKSKLFKRDRK